VPRQRVTTIYSKAGGRKMKRIRDEEPKNFSKAFIPRMGKPEGLSELTQYVTDNQDPETSLPSTLDLIRQFQEEHKHGSFVLAKTGNYARTRTAIMCPIDGHVRFLGN
jgi:hypothetical protein